MNSLFYILHIVIFFTSCGNVIDKTDIGKPVVSTFNTSNIIISKEYESIEVKHWNGFVARLHKLEYLNGKLKLYCDESDFKSEIKNNNKINQLIGLIEQFYIEKTDQIILTKKKSKYINTSNYSSIEIKIKNEEELLVDEITQIGSEKYDIEYNPEFLRLYELVEELTNFCSE